VRTKALLIAALVAFVCAPSALPQATQLMPGVSYAREVKVISGRQVVVHVVTAPKPGGLYELAPVLSNETIVGRETVSAMEKRLSKKATVVGVNGDLFNSEIGYPSGIFMRGGVLQGHPSPDRSSLGIGLDGILRVAWIGFTGTWAVGESRREELTQLNRPLDGPGVGLFSPAWGNETPRLRRAVDVVLTGFPQAAPSTDLTAQILRVRQGGGTPIPRDGAVLQGVGRGARQLRELAVPGLPGVVRVILRPWWENVADAIGGGPALVRNGRIALPTAEAFTSYVLLPRHPRTAVGQLRDGRIVFVAVDGRQTWTAGVSMRDLARVLVDLGVVTGMAFDGGGGTTLAFDGRILNTPSDGSERTTSTALMMLYYGAYAREPRFAVVSPNGDGFAEEQRLAYKIVRPSMVTARLLGPNGAVVSQEEGQKGPGTYPLVPARGALGEGSWRFVVSAVDADGATSEAERRFSVNNTLGFLELSRKRLKATARRAGTVAISFRVARSARVRVTVEDRFGRVLRTLQDRIGQQPGAVSLSWNGRTGSGRVVASGSYVIHVFARNAVGAVDLTDSVLVQRR
jgi:hypothetical protein